MTNMLQQILLSQKLLGVNQQNELRYMRRVEFSPRLSLLPHLALPLLVPSKELSNLIQEAGVLLPAAQAEGGLCRAACRCHGCSSGW